MDCRETQTLLTAFHDGELPAADRARVEGHLRGCPECGARLADLARVDRAAGVPDPGPAYWDRFNARVMDRVEREADGPGVAVLRPKGGWMRQQFRYLVPAAAAAALVVVVVRYGGMHPVAPTPAVPPAVSEPAAPDSGGQRAAQPEPKTPATERREPAAVARRVPEESNRVAETPAEGHGWPGAGTGRDTPGSAVPAPLPAVADERLVTAARGERDRLPDRPLSEAKERTSRDRAAAGPRPVASMDGMAGTVQGEQKKMAEAAAPAAEPQYAAKAESSSGMRMTMDKSAEAPTAVSLGKTREKGGSSPVASAPSRADSPCELARTLAARKRWREAEAAQRACLAQDPSAPAQEKGLVFLAELLDRQARFADADAVITEVDRQFPQSRPLDLYRQQRPMVQMQPAAVPVTR